MKKAWRFRDPYHSLSGGWWHPALPGCQDFIGPNPSVFLDSEAKVERIFLKFEINRRQFHFVFYFWHRGRIWLLATTV